MKYCITNDNKIYKFIENLKKEKVTFMYRYFIQVFGRVQGVGFRNFASYMAKSFNLTGWVKNCDDESVSMEVQGEAQYISLFIEKINKGNAFVKVENINCRNIENIENERSFRVIY